MNNTIQGNRIHFLDNLRTFMVFLVILLHAAIVYEKNAMGALFWIVIDPSQSGLPGILFVFLDIFVIATLFFISGFCTPLSLKNKNEWTFLKSKFKRLMLPWLIAVLTLIPLYKLIFLSSRHIPQESWTTYFHWNAMWSQNWLWFLPVLFAFDILYLCLSKIRISLSHISFKKALGIILLMSFLYGFCMDIFNLQGWTKTILIDFQNERLFIYFLIFLFGSLCSKLRLFDSEWKNRKLNLILHCTGWIPISFYIFLYINALMKPGDYLVSRIIDTLILHLNFVLSLAYLLYLLITTFRKYLNKQTTITRELNRNSYYVYIIHTIVMGGIAILMLSTTIPSLLKFLILTVTTFGACHLIIYCYRKVVQTIQSTHKIKEPTMKTIPTAIVLIVLLSVAGCGKKENSDEEKQPPRVSLHVAALQGNLHVTQQHIDAGSDLDEKDEYGSSPLIVAATFGKTDVAKALINAGADLSVTNNEGATPLHVAAFFCRTEIVRALLDKGADKTALNKTGHTAQESVAGPFEDVKVIYDGIGKGLKPLGLKLDYKRIEKTRPEIAEMLR